MVRPRELVVGAYNWVRGRGMMSARLSRLDRLPTRAAPVIIKIRYSMLLRSQKGRWYAGRNRPFEDYKADVLNEERLAQRLFLFRHVVLPSLMAQSTPLDPRLHQVILFTSQDMPKEAAATLSETVAGIPWIRIVTVDPEAYMPQYAEETLQFLETFRGPEKLPYASVRLDDDDALGRKFIERVSAYAVPRCVGRAVTFASGYVGNIHLESGRYESFHKDRIPKTAQGLTYIGQLDRSTGTVTSRHRTVYDLRDHTRADARAKTIVDTSFPAFIRTQYAEQDTGVAPWWPVSKRKPLVARQLVEEHIGLSDAI